MLKLSLTLLIIGFLAAPITSNGQEIQKEKQAEISTKVEPLSFDKTTYKFGNIEKGSPAVATFTVKNNASAPLVITHVSTSCGCTASAFPKEPILQGKSGEIKLTYDSKRVGYFKKSAQVKTKNSKFYTLYIEGDVKVKPAEAGK